MGLQGERIKKEKANRWGFAEDRAKGSEENGRHYPAKTGTVSPGMVNGAARSDPIFGQSQHSSRRGPEKASSRSFCFALEGTPKRHSPELKERRPFLHFLPMVEAILCRWRYIVSDFSWTPQKKLEMATQTPYGTRRPRKPRTARRSRITRRT